MICWSHSITEFCFGFPAITRTSVLGRRQLLGGLTSVTALLSGGVTFQNTSAVFMYESNEEFRLTSARAYL